MQRYHYESTTQLHEHLQTFSLAYNHAKRLKRLRGLTPHEFVGAQWQKNPLHPRPDPTHSGTIHLVKSLVQKSRCLPNEREFRS